MELGEINGSSWKLVEGNLKVEDGKSRNCLNWG